MKTPSKKSRIEFNHDRRECSVGGKEVYLPHAEYEVLKALFETGKCLTRTDLARALGHAGDAAETYALGRVVDQHIARLRRKVGAEIIQTVTKAGYKISNSSL